MPLEAPDFENIQCDEILLTVKLILLMWDAEKIDQFLCLQAEGEKLANGTYGLVNFLVIKGERGWVHLYVVLLGKLVVGSGFLSWRLEDGGGGQELH